MSQIDHPIYARVPKQREGPRIAVIGAGITGVSAACHILEAGIECHIFEAGDEQSVGGIWTRQNSTSSLQIHSEFYQFHPDVEWSCSYPKRHEILQQTRILWDRFRLQDRTTFSCPVNDIQRAGERYVINDKKYGAYDSVIVAIGTCSKLCVPKIPRQGDYQGQVCHSSDLDDLDVLNKDVAIVGGGASSIEAMEYAARKGASSVKVITRSDKWIVPRWRLLGILLALVFFDPFGIFDRGFECFLRIFCYRGLGHVAPARDRLHSVYSTTPVVNSRFFNLLNSGTVTWIQGDCQRFVEKGLEVQRRGTQPHLGSKPLTEQCDICIYATGYQRPTIEFLSKFANGYTAPSWFLQVFPPGTPTICAINSTWVHGIGSVGAAHIGMYTRLLLVYTLDARTRPSKSVMCAWVWVVETILKPFHGLAFITTAEMYVWFLVLIAFQPQLWGWGRYILGGHARALDR